MVPRGGWRHTAKKIKEAVNIPVAATNRINTPEIGEELLRDGDADIVALGRQMLADPDFAIKADQLGSTEAWIGQHHTVAWEPIPSNDLFIANVLPRTKQIRLGSGVSILPQHHPVNVAVRLAYLDHLSRGRINCGFGQGGV